MDGQTKSPNNTIKAYLLVFINFEQNKWARLLLVAEFVYNNAKNAITSHTHFKLNCEYYPYVSYKENFNPHSKSKIIKKSSSKL